MSNKTAHAEFIHSVKMLNKAIDEIEMRPADVAYKVGLGVSEWESFATKEELQLSQARQQFNDAYNIYMVPLSQ
jgi:hypothetical protein